MDETRTWVAWANWLGVPHLTFSAVLGAVIERGEHHRRVVELLRPGADFVTEREKMRRADRAPQLGTEDLYPDAAPCLRTLADRGYRIGLVGNQPESIEPALRALGLAVDVIASSEGWGVEKPSPAFFEKIVEAAGQPAERIAYVGDRLDNDVLPALEAGMVAVFLRRGPWGVVHANRPEVAKAHIRLEGLTELPAALRSL